MTNTTKIPIIVVKAPIKAIRSLGSCTTAPGIFASTKLGDTSFAVRNPIDGYTFSESTRLYQEQVKELTSPPSPASLQNLPSQKSIEEQLFDATASVKIMTSRVAMHLEREWREKLFNQMDSLHDPLEWMEEDTPIEKSSFATFLKAICQIKPKNRPGLGLAHGGNLIAAWTSGSNRLTVEFLAKDRVRWIISRFRDEEPEQYVGQTVVSHFLESLQPYQPNEWFGK